MCVLLVLRDSAFSLTQFKELFFVAAIEKSGWAVLCVGAIKRVLCDSRTERVYYFNVVVIFLESVAT